MKPIIVADTGPLIALAKLHHLDLLPAIFDAVYVPQTVYDEATQDNYRNDADTIDKFIQSYTTVCQTINNPFSQNISTILDAGETQALALAKQLDCGVLMDERKGRQIANHYQIHAIGTLGVLLQAKKQGKIKAIKPLISELQNVGYRLSPKLIEYALTKASES